MHADYVNPVIRELRDQQVRFAPREKKLEQVNRAEKLLAELDPSRTYTYEYLCYRITDFRPESYPDMKVAGRRHDPRPAVVRRRPFGRGRTCRPKRPASRC